jgi:predicted GNAT family N-acyltransferase
LTNFQFKKIEFDSIDYWKIVMLRERILRLPLNLRFSWEELMREKENLNFGIEHENKWIATTQFIKEGRKFKMRQVAVDKKWQSKKVGSYLLESAEGYISKYDPEMIYCHARDTAVDFYINNGYKVIGEMFIEVNIPHYLMEKKFNA